MSQDKPRAPVAVALGGDQQQSSQSVTFRKPIAANADLAKVSTDDHFAHEDAKIVGEMTADEEALSKTGSRLAVWFFSALGALISLAAGLWADQLITELFARADWLGWLGLGALVIAALCVVLILVREMAALMRLNNVNKLKHAAINAIETNSMHESKAVVKRFQRHFAGNERAQPGLQKLAALDDEIIDGADLIALAEVEVLAPLDQQAKALIRGSAKRVSVVTAVSPRAIVDVGYILIENARLIRRLSALYGGRPGSLGMLKLTRWVISHLALTGAIAAGEGLIQQLVGQGLAARISTRLGEGVVNGLMTARIGIAAMEVTRPLPFVKRSRPGLTDFLADLSSSGNENQSS